MTRRRAKMNEILRFFVYLGIMAGVTYLVRMLPMVFFRRKIKSRFVRSFLYYVPYTVLAVMTIPGIFYSTGSLASAIAGAAVAVLPSVLGRSLLTVAAGSALGVLIVEIILRYIIGG